MNKIANILLFPLAVLVAITIVFVDMLLSFAFGYFFGWVLQFTPLAEVISNGMNLLFGTTRFTPDNFPLFMASLIFLMRFVKPKLKLDKEDKS